MRGVINTQHLRGGEKEFIGCHQPADDSLGNCYLFLWLDIPVIKGSLFVILSSLSGVRMVITGASPSLRLSHYPGR